MRLIMISTLIIMFGVCSFNVQITYSENDLQSRRLIIDMLKDFIDKMNQNSTTITQRSSLNFLKGRRDETSKFGDNNTYGEVNKLPEAASDEDSSNSLFTHALESLIEVLNKSITTVGLVTEKSIDDNDSDSKESDFLVITTPAPQNKTEKPWWALSNLFG